MFSLTLCLALVVLCYPAGAAYGHYHPRLIVDSNDLLDNLQNHKDGNDNTNGDSHIFWKSSRNNRFPNYLRNGFWKKRVPSQRKSKTIDDLLPWHPLPPPQGIFKPLGEPVLTEEVQKLLKDFNTELGYAIGILLQAVANSVPKYIFKGVVPEELLKLMPKPIIV
ncbi:uncharacterized protein LOC126745208 isoform X3 [Anthonomus grandis grandis]|uniref:uncharacterized protein LOC126745208 isoform X3 n=1 Tax=Anthonomus grandis grandis TaxID=2921223 RepID=UPI0021665218|nr:uncharacterized protein LOC126745208 isoform X3 [Anthonomus grandis grandis]